MNDKKSYQLLTQKQIIKELKCLIAKQQQQINKLIEQIDALKKQKGLYSFKSHSFEIKKSHSVQELQTPNQQKQHSSRFTSNNPSVVNSRSPTHNGYQMQSFLQRYHETIKEFTLKTIQPLNQKYMVPLKKSGNINQRQKSLQVQQILKASNFDTLIEFSQFLPFLLKQIRSLMKCMDQTYEIKTSKYKSLMEKLKEQEKTLKQIFNEYEKNIVNSENVEAKLMEQIKRLKGEKQKFKPLHKAEGLRLNSQEEDYYDE